LLEPQKQLKVNDLAQIQFYLPCNAVSMLEIILE
jgi:hypothetical protein